MGGPSTVTTKTKPSFPGWINSGAQDYFGKLQGLTYGPGGYQGQNQDQSAGLSDIRGAIPQAQQGISTGIGSLENLATLSGGPNPYLDQMSQAGTASITNEYRNATAPSEMIGALQSGAAGGSEDVQARAKNEFGLGQNLANFNSQLYGGAYSQDRSNQLQAASQLPQASTAAFAPGKEQLGIGNFLQQQPFQILQQFMQSFAPLLGAYGGSTQIGPNPQQMSFL